MDYQKAVELATSAHKGQTRWSGAPYIMHPLAVSGIVSKQFPGDEAARIAAVLHDVVEDTEISLDDLRAAGFSEDIVMAVDAVTKREGEKYCAFVFRAARHSVGRRVKIADIQHNLSDLSKDHGLRKKYEPALESLLATEEASQQERE